jgi:N-acetylmuramoyl-L-alanine amidase
VRAIDSSAGSAQLIIEVSGKVDYAVARAGHELVIRIAPAGTVNDLATPLMVELKRKRHLAAAIVSAPLTLPRSGSISTASKPTVPVLIADQSILPKVAPANAAAASPPTDFGQRDYVPSERLRPVAIIPRRPLSKRPLVMIDPGHGGRDPGTEAAGVVGEKDVALQIAQYLRQTLELRGVDAQLTRGDDTFLSLGERTQLANNAHADLFISIHLNSNRDMNLSGIETYYLNNSSDRATIRLARMENGVAGGYGAPGNPDLNYILTDLRQGYKANESASLARMIESESVAGVDSSLGLRVNALGAKKGPFYVLVGAEMPSVLVECGFLSNPGEARLLSESRYQRALADGIAVAVMDYFNASAAVGNL